MSLAGEDWEEWYKKKIHFIFFFSAKANCPRFRASVSPLLVKSVRGNIWSEMLTQSTRHGLNIKWLVLC